MTSEESQSGVHGSSHHSEHSIALLLKHAGERAQPSDAAMQQARAAARLSWQQAVHKNQLAIRRHRLKPLFFGGALAASILLIASVMLMRTKSPMPVEVGQIVKIDGVIDAIDQQRSLPLREGGKLMSNQTIATSQGRVAISMGALSLRLDRDTRLVELGAHDVRLDYGRLYVDSGRFDNHAVLRIHTANGVIQHVGTQFQVIANHHATQVLVREGRVRIDANTSQPVRLDAGQAITVIDGAPGKIQAQTGYGTDWAWVADIAPDFDIEGRPLGEFLAWIAREHGWQLRYTSADLERAALDTRLHGTILSPDIQQQLINTGLITGTQLHVENGVLIVTQLGEGE